LDIEIENEFQFQLEILRTGAAAVNKLKTGALSIQHSAVSTQHSVPWLDFRGKELRSGVIVQQRILLGIRFLSQPLNCCGAEC
jgi:hypothetical protein